MSTRLKRESKSDERVHVASAAKSGQQDIQLSGGRKGSHCGIMKSVEPDEPSVQWVSVQAPVAALESVCRMIGATRVPRISIACISF
jgi:hypothetical protein